jgi:hypothetical protein
VTATGAREHRVELLATVLLAVAAIATAWTTFQSGRWRGQQAVDSNRSQAARIQSSEAHTRAGQLTEIDIATFVQWVDAHTAGQPKLAQFYRARFRAEFRPAFDAWVATTPFTNPQAPSSPFVLPQYRLAQTREAERLAASATVRSAAAGDADQHADDYLLALVLFASALFFAGISTKLKAIRQREVLLAIGWLLFIGSAAWVATRPVTFSI